MQVALVAARSTVRPSRSPCAGEEGDRGVGEEREGRTNEPTTSER